MLFSLLVLETLSWIDDLLGADQRRLSSSESIRDELGRSVRSCDTLESAVFGADWRRVVARRRLRPSSLSSRSPRRRDRRSHRRLFLSVRSRTVGRSGSSRRSCLGRLENGPTQGKPMELACFSCARRPVGGTSAKRKCWSANSVYSDSFRFE